MGVEISAEGCSGVETLAEVILSMVVGGSVLAPCGEENGVDSRGVLTPAVVPSFVNWFVVTPADVARGVVTRGVVLISLVAPTVLADLVDTAEDVRSGVLPSGVVKPSDVTSGVVK